MNENPQPLLTAAQAKSLDTHLREALGISTLVLMENAGRAVAEEALKAAHGKGRVAIFCGRGNNGGDGFVAARHLVARGLEPDVFLAGTMADLKDEAKINAEILSRLQIRIFEVDEEALGPLKRKTSDCGVIIDALLGVGLEGEVRGICRDLIDMINDSRAYVIAVDIPSGLDATNGKVLGACVKAEETVTFIARKRGMACGKGPEMCGEVVVSDLGIPNAYEIR